MNNAGSSILYIDPFSGVSGDMLLAAFLSLGVPLDVVSASVDSVIPGEVRISVQPVIRSGLAGLACEVEVLGGPERRTLEEMTGLVKGAGLPRQVEEGSLRALRSLGEAERSAHGLDEGGPVHLHELGGQDTLADIVGSLTALHHIGPDVILSGPVNLGHGYVQTSHGTMPVPAPATAHLVRGMSVFAAGPAVELTTPTGAAILRATVDRFGPMEAMDVGSVGTGAGSRDVEGLPNLLRVFSGRRQVPDGEGTAVMIECGIDDVSPEYLAPVTEALQSAGAREVQIIPAHTKKGRVGVLLRVLAAEGNSREVVQAVLENSGSPGLRFWKVERAVQPREQVTITTPHGEVSFKRWRTPSGRWRFKAEFEDIQRLARETGIPAATMRDMAVAAYLAEVGDGQEED